MFQLDACIGDGELPVNAGLRGVSAFGPGLGLASQNVDVGA
jgi:hypothetical protein